MLSSTGEFQFWRDAGVDCAQLVQDERWKEKGGWLDCMQQCAHGLNEMLR